MFCKRTSTLEPRAFLPVASSFLRSSLSSRSQFKASAWSEDPDAVARGVSAAAIGQATGSVMKVPSRMWAICVGKAFMPSNICVASSYYERDRSWGLSKV